MNALSTGIVAVVVACITSLLLAKLARRVAPRFRFVDNPDGHRKLHKGAVPLGGGIAVFLAMSIVLGGLLVLPNPLRLRLHDKVPELPVILLAALAIVAVGVLDDRIRLRGYQKLIGQLLAAAILIAGGVVIDTISLFNLHIILGVWAIPFTLFWLLGAVNALNLLDGADGLATTVGIILSATICGMAVLVGRPPEVALVAAVFAACLVGFLRFNFPPATIFLGDAGSMLIGLMVGTMSIAGSLKGPGTILLAASVAALTLPVFDCAAAILRRVLTGRSIYAGDRAHVHHRLLDRLGSSRKVLFWIGLGCGLASLGALTSVVLKSDSLALLAALGVVTIFLATGIFGRAEVALIRVWLGRATQGILPSKTYKSVRARESCICFRGDETWRPLWNRLTDSAKQLGLRELQINVHSPLGKHEYQAIWKNAGRNRSEHTWSVKFPLEVGQRFVGSLKAVGTNGDGSMCHSIQELTHLVEPFEQQILDGIENPSPKAKQSMSQGSFLPRGEGEEESLVLTKPHHPGLLSREESVVSLPLPTRDPMTNAFCVDLEEWFHICGVQTQYDDPKTWDAAPSLVEQNTDILLRLFDDADVKATFLVLGWIAERYPRLVRRISDLGHEIGCHGHYHRLVFEQSPEEFRQEISVSRRILQDVSGQPVTCFRAPGFSIRKECFWAYPILAEEGFHVDVSIVPASRDHGGIDGFHRNLFRMATEHGELTIFPVSVMRVAGMTVPFSGGGYLRLFPMPLVRHGFRDNHKRGLPVMAYIHPRDVDPSQPRLKLPCLKRFKYYVGLGRCEARIRALLNAYRFGRVTDVIREHDQALRTLYLGPDAKELTQEPPIGGVWHRRGAVAASEKIEPATGSEDWPTRSKDTGHQASKST